MVNISEVKIPKVKIPPVNIKLDLYSFLAALGLMSRLPIGNVELTEEHQNRSSIWYPAVGLLLGLLLIIFVWVSPNAWPVFLPAVILLIIWVSYTGAMHLEGLADSADAWVGGMNDQQRTLDILKDPTCGPTAVVALVLALLLKFALILSLWQSPLIIALLVVPMLARAWILPTLLSMPDASAANFDAQAALDAQAAPDTQTAPVSEETDGEIGDKGGMASDKASDFPKIPGQISFVVAQFMAFALFLTVPSGVMLWVACGLVSFGLFFILRRISLDRIGGYTGDILGAGIELQEIALLLTCAIFL